MKPLVYSALGFPLVALFSIVGSSWASAATSTWYPTASGTYGWNNASNWGTGSGPIPTSTDAAIANSSGAAQTQTINLGADTSVGSFQINGGTANYYVTISDAGNGYTLTTGSLSVQTKCYLTINANLSALSGSVVLSTAGTGYITLGAGYTVTAPLSTTGAAVVNLNSNLNTGSATTALTVNQGTLNWNVGTFTSTSTAANVLNISSAAYNKTTTVNFQRSLNSTGGITLAGNTTNGSVIALYGTVNGVTISNNIVAGTSANAGTKANTITLGANNTAATSGSQTTVTFAGNYTTTDPYARTHSLFAAAYNTAVFSGVIASSGTGTIFQKTGAGTVILNGASANTSTASMEVAAGTLLLQKTSGVALSSSTVTVDSGATLQLGGASQIASTSAAYVAGGAFDLQSYNQTLGSVQLTNGGTIAGTGTLSATSTYDLQAGSVSANLSGAVGVNKTTSSRVMLSGSNTYSGDTNVSSGILEVNGSLSANSAVNINSGATLSGSGKINGTVSGTDATINGNGLNLGATTLTGASTLSGTNTASRITIAGGTTSLTGTTQSTSTLLVSAGATLNNNGTVSGNVGVSGLLKGNGTITGNLSLTSGILAPDSSAAMTTVLGNFSMDGDSKLVVDVTGKSAGVTYDQLKISGNISLAGTLDLRTLSGLAMGDTITLIENTGIGTTAGHFSEIVTSGGTYRVATDGLTYTFTVNSTQYEISYAANIGNDGQYNDVTLTVVPEASTWTMVLGGLGLLTFGQRLRRRISGKH